MEKEGVDEGGMRLLFAGSEVPVDVGRVRQRSVLMVSDELALRSGVWMAVAAAGSPGELGRWRFKNADGRPGACEHNPGAAVMRHLGLDGQPCDRLQVPRHWERGVGVELRNVMRSRSPGIRGAARPEPIAGE